MTTYRKHINKNLVISDEVEDNIKYVDLDIVIDTLDDIESKLNGIKDMLEEINGLSEIDNIKELVKKLINELY